MRLCDEVAAFETPRNREENIVRLDVMVCEQEGRVEIACDDSPVPQGDPLASIGSQVVLRLQRLLGPV